MKLSDILTCTAYIEAQIRGPMVHKRVNSLSLTDQPFAVPEKLEWEINCSDNCLVLSTEFKFGMKENGFPCNARIYAPIFGSSDAIIGSWHVRINYDDMDAALGRLPQTFPSKFKQPQAA